MAAKRRWFKRVDNQPPLITATGTIIAAVISAIAVIAVAKFAGSAPKATAVAGSNQIENAMLFSGDKNTVSFYQKINSDNTLIFITENNQNFYITNYQVSQYDPNAVIKPQTSQKLPIESHVTSESGNLYFSVIKNQSFNFNDSRSLKYGEDRFLGRKFPSDVPRKMVDTSITITQLDILLECTQIGFYQQIPESSFRRFLSPYFTCRLSRPNTSLPGISFYSNPGDVLIRAPTNYIGQDLIWSASVKTGEFPFGYQLSDIKSYTKVELPNIPNVLQNNGIGVLYGVAVTVYVNGKLRFWCMNGPLIANEDVTKDYILRDLTFSEPE
jgi:hypothetical protein